MDDESVSKTARVSQRYEHKVLDGLTKHFFFFSHFRHPLFDAHFRPCPSEIDSLDAILASNNPHIKKIILFFLQKWNPTIHFINSLPAWSRNIT